MTTEAINCTRGVLIIENQYYPSSVHEIGNRKIFCKTNHLSIMHQIINIQENHASLAFRKYGYSITISVYAFLDYYYYYIHYKFTWPPIRPDPILNRPYF